MATYMNGINGAFGRRLFETLIGEGVRGVSSTSDISSIYCDLRALKPLDGNFFGTGRFDVVPGGNFKVTLVR